MANKKTKTDITVILPVHELSSDVNIKLFEKSVTSVASQDVGVDELLIVVPKGSEVEKFFKTYDFADNKSLIRVVSNPNSSDFQTQVNYGVSQAKTEWISILEFDDEYSLKWFMNVVKYRAAFTDVDIFMPIIVDINSADRGFLGLTNEAVWANSFSEELGVLDEKGLLAFQNFNIDGITMKKSTFETNGGFKKNIKLTFIYEFLLRMTFNAAKAMVIPKLGYQHLNQREGSLFANYKSEINALDAEFWLTQARKEYFHKHERDITEVETSN